MISDYTSKVFLYWLKILFVAFLLIGGLFGVVLIATMVIKSNTPLTVTDLPSKNGNLYHVRSGISGSSDDDYASHFLFIKNISIPIDSIAYLDLLNTSLIYLDTVQPSNYKQIPVKKIVILKSLDGWMKMRGHDNQNWEKIGKNEIAIIEKKDNSIINTRYKKDNQWKYIDYKYFLNTQQNYTFKNIKEN